MEEKQKMASTEAQEMQADKDLRKVKVMFTGRGPRRGQTESDE